MKKNTIACVALAALGLSAVAPALRADDTIYALGNGGASLYAVPLSTPSAVPTVIPVTGTAVGESIVAIDVSPQDPGVVTGYSSANQLYKINPSTGVATLQSSFPTRTATAGLGAGVVNSTYPPSGGVKIDFNPAANPPFGALRIESTGGQNYRYVPNTNVLNLDGALTYAAGGTPTVVGQAYTNNDNDAATTTALFVMDAATDALYLQAPPNDGKLTLVGTTLGIGDVPTSGVGFDVPINGTTNAYASIGGGFYSVNLTAGTATSLGSFNAAAVNVTDIAIVPEPSAAIALLLGMGLLGATRRRRA